MNQNVNDIELMEECERKAEEAVELEVIDRSQQDDYALHLFEIKKRGDISATPNLITESY